MTNVPFIDNRIFSPTLLAVSALTLLSAFTPFMMFLRLLSPSRVRVVGSQTTEDGHCVFHVSCLSCLGHTVFTRLNAAAFIKFLAFPMRRLFKGGVYSRAAFISKSYFLNH